MRKAPAILIIITIIAVIFGFKYYFVDYQNNNQIQPDNTFVIKVGSLEFKSEVMDTPELKAKGLSGKTGLEADQAMLFTYDQPGNYCFWMKDMLFSIDMIWLNMDKTINTIHKNVSPDTYPDQSFCPVTPAQYIVEVAAGTADANNWQKDTQFSF
ncbi:MAG: DUF192 domain-containing protein [bacterium]|nr:DUF192 domain-containing protein [bacterium]